MDDNIWRSPAPHSLSNRKREYGSAHLGTGEQSKSRRTTPSRRDRSTSRDGPRNLHSVDIIDLTGYDVDFDSACIARQLMQEKMQKQESMDRHLALQLSGQKLPRQDPSTAAPSGTAHTDAFLKLIPAQTSNPHTPVANGDVSKSSENHGESSASHNPQSLPMPGAYDAHLNEHFSLGPQTPTRQAAFANPQTFPHNSVLPGAYDAHLNEHFSLGPQTPTRQAAFANPQTFPHNSVLPGASFNTSLWESPYMLPSQTGTSPMGGFNPVSGMPMGGFNPASGMPGLNSAPGLPSSGLMGVIAKTSMFDYSAHIDQQGNPLPDRLSSFIHDAYHDPRVSEKELDDLLQNIRPDMDIPEMNRDLTPPGLKSTLYPHQELAISWMKSMEEGTNKGGILADDMGLGKTISTLALMLARPGTSRLKTNLIIGPVSLIRQWEEEIAKKTKPSYRLSVFVYHNKRATTEHLLKHDVVLTTYPTIAQECRRLDEFIEANVDRNIDFNDRAMGHKFPLLNPSKAEFYRIILDEAQCIKNKETKTAKACHRLKAKYRWCLTGTPMMNGVLELFSLVHFLNIKPYCVWEQFRQAFGTLFGRKGDPKSVAMSRLRALLKAIMLRRKKDSQLDGKPILKLPPKIEHTIYAELSPDETGFYKQLEEKSQVQFSKYLREGTVGKNYSSIFVLLLRMRQACCHPHLNLDVDDATPVSSEDMIKLVNSLSTSTVERIRAIEAFECPICFDAVQSPSFFIPCGHDSCKDCLIRSVENAAVTNLQAGNESDRAKCPVCRGSFDPKNCFTYDAFRSVHMPETVEKPEPGVDSGDEDSDSDHGTDDEVDERGNLKDFVVDDIDYTGYVKPSSTAEADKASVAMKMKRKMKGKKKTPPVKPSMLKSLRMEAAKNIDAYKRYMRYLRKTWMPAAKVTACMDLLKKIQETGEKTIVFSQWTLLLDLLQVAMWHEKFNKPERYDGSMSGEERARAAQNFRERHDITVMLVSLRAGNAGLNLTSASNVIIMDPFWNPYIEMQAVDRAYRIGQQRDVKVYRILTKETVEDRIIALQDRKKMIVEAALDETESMKIGHLNVSELKFLFNARD